MKKTNVKSLTYLLQNKQTVQNKNIMNRVQSHKVLYNLNQNKINKNNSSIKTSFSFYEDPFAVKLKKNFSKDNKSQEKKILSGGHWKVNNQLQSNGFSQHSLKTNQKFQVKEEPVAKQPSASKFQNTNIRSATTSKNYLMEEIDQIQANLLEIKKQSRQDFYNEVNK